MCGSCAVVVRIVFLFLLACGPEYLQAQQGADVEDRFWHGTDPRTVSRSFPDEASQTAGPGTVDAAAILDEAIVILKRETPFARIEPTGEVFVLGTRKGRLVADSGGLRIVRDATVLGRITAEGFAIRAQEPIGRVDSDGYLYDAVGEYRGSFSGEGIWIDGWVWGSASLVVSPSQMWAAAAFLFFFTELPEWWGQ